MLKQLKCKFKIGNIKFFYLRSWIVQGGAKVGIQYCNISDIF